MARNSFGKTIGENLKPIEKSNSVEMSEDGITPALPDHDKAQMDFHNSMAATHQAQAEHHSKHAAHHKAMAEQHASKHSEKTGTKY
jgi:hypothetical protein